MQIPIGDVSIRTPDKACTTIQGQGHSKKAHCTVLEHTVGWHAESSSLKPLQRCKS